MTKKVLCYIVTFICVFSMVIYPVSAVNIEYDINYWYSNNDNVGIWTDKSLNVYIANASNSAALSVANLQGYMLTSLSSWSVTGISTVYVSNVDNADLVLSGITRSDATSLNISTNTVGVTLSTCPTQLATLRYGSSQKRLVRIDSAIVFLVECDETSTTTGARKVTTHEMGHAFGYFGHYDNGTVMTTYYQNITSLIPSNAEINHLHQVY